MFKLYYPNFWNNKNIFTFLLWIPSKLYFFAGLLRFFFVRPIKLPAPVICVGNLSVGGTGKTQIVIWLIKLLKKQNLNIVVITKAYKGKIKTAKLVDNYDSPSIVGDESIMLAQYATVIASPKIKNSIDIIKSIKPDIIIVDDGIQNPSFVKDFVILSIDGLRGFGNGYLIPAGPLRQYPKVGIASADAIIILEQPKNTSLTITKLQKLSNTRQNLSIFHATNRATGDFDKTINYFAFSGIGNPERFFKSLNSAGLNLVGVKIFPDHHLYSDEDYRYLERQSNEFAATLITTSKDYVKVCQRLAVKNFEIELLIDNEQKLENLIYAKICKKN